MTKTKPRSIEEIIEFNKRSYRDPVITIGDNTKIHPSSTLGGDGFTWAREEDGSILQAHNLGDITIEDNVRIGEHCTIRRSTLPNTSTIIGRGSVLISYVNVGHNCIIGKNNFLGPHVALNGSVHIGDGCWIAAHAVIHQGVKIGDGAIVGMGAVVKIDVQAGETVVGDPAGPIKFAGNYVHPSITYGRNLELGKYNHIHEKVVLGDDVKIRSYVELRPDTVIGNRVYLDSGVKTSGECWIKDDVTLRYDSIIAKGCVIEDHVFISPQFMTENLNHKGESIGGAKIGVGSWDRKNPFRVFIGTDVTLVAGITICPDVVIGTKANVRKSITEPGVYLGNPARKIQ